MQLEATRFLLSSWQKGKLLTSRKPFRSEISARFVFFTSYQLSTINNNHPNADWKQLYGGFMRSIVKGCVAILQYTYIYFVRLYPQSSGVRQRERGWLEKRCHIISRPIHHWVSVCAARDDSEGWGGGVEDGEQRLWWITAVLMLTAVFKNTPNVNVCVWGRETMFFWHLRWDVNSGICTRICFLFLSAFFENKKEKEVPVFLNQSRGAAA